MSFPALSAFDKAPKTHLSNRIKVFIHIFALVISFA
ncbi:hypothetical protein FHT97_003674 [Rhizobium sp. BK399]|nr:hypothetical protein [Rhizobium sp. BK399]MCS3743028.1 hypothetical protein [Rhizobium sp. BK661]